MEDFNCRTVSNGVDPENLKVATIGWEWYSEVRGTRFRERQKIEEVSQAIAHAIYFA
jgi:hypothetical protein